MSTISIIIPTWNRQESLQRAIHSVLCQTLEITEVLICDDGSTDASREVVNAIGDPRVRWVAGPRGGRPAIPRNRGIRESRGEWLAFLDDDDEWLPEKLAQQLALAKKLDCLAVCADAFRLVPGTGVVGALLARPATRLTFSDLLHVNRVICSSVLIHRSLFDVVEGFPEEPQLIACEDYALWLRVATQTDFAYVSEPLLSYRDDPKNSVRQAGPDERNLRKHVLGDFLHWASRAKLPHRYKWEARRLYRTIIRGELWAHWKAFFSQDKRSVCG